MIGPVHRLYAARRPHCRCAGWGQLRGQTPYETCPTPREVPRFDLKSAGGDSGNRTRDRGFADRNAVAPIGLATGSGPGSHLPWPVATPWPEWGAPGAARWQPRST